MFSLGSTIGADHPAGLPIGGAPYRLHGDLHGLAIALELDCDRLAAAAADDLVEAHGGMDRMAGGGEDQIALLEANFLCGHARGDRTQLHFAFFGPPRRAHAGALVEHGRHGGIEFFAVTRNGQLHGARGALDFFEDDVVPGGIALAAQLDDAIAFLDAGLGCRRVRRHAPITAPLSASTTF